ncbi:hypothetical protein M5K25_020222 [Dendrobium thyrsiflorum]|uniref:Uncharacterized protein n=1 Tax=Dendrobium thyrsiflorum TaxID=117978 RepID=A0ABD0U9H9_DENTH
MSPNQGPEVLLEGSSRDRIAKRFAVVSTSYISARCQTLVIRLTLITGFSSNLWPTADLLQSSDFCPLKTLVLLLHEVVLISVAELLPVDGFSPGTGLTPVPGLLPEDRLSSDIYQTLNLFPSVGLRKDPAGGPMEEQMRLYIRLAMEDSGFHLHTSMDNNMYNLINVTRFPSFDTSARMSLRTLSIKDFVLFSQKIWCRRVNLGFPNPRSSVFLAPLDHLSFRLLVSSTITTFVSHRGREELAYQKIRVHTLQASSNERGRETPVQLEQVAEAASAACNLRGGRQRRARFLQAAGRRTQEASVSVDPANVLENGASVLLTPVAGLLPVDRLSSNFYLTPDLRLSLDIRSSPNLRPPPPTTVLTTSFSDYVFSANRRQPSAVAGQQGGNRPPLPHAHAHSAQPRQAASARPRVRRTAGAAADGYGQAAQSTSGPDFCPGKVKSDVFGVPETVFRRS